MKQAVTGKDHYDKMANTPVSRLIVSLGIPTTITMLITSIYNMADTAFVGQLGTSASGAVGIVFGFMSIMQAVGFMFGQGGGINLSRRLGAKNLEEANRYASTAFFGSFGLGLLLMIFSLIFLTPLIWFLGSTETIFPYAKSYLTAILVAAPMVISSFTMNNLLRYEGHAALGMVGMMTGSILNIILDPILMFVFHMGVLGAGVATAGSQMISFGILLSMFIRGKSATRISIHLVAKDFRVWWNIVTTGFPSMLRQGLTSMSTMVLNNCAAVYGDAAVAAMAIVNRIAMFMFSVGLGVGQGYQPVCAFSYGAKRYDRLRAAFRFTMLLGECLMAVFAVCGLIAAPYAIQIFRDDPAVIEIGIRALRLRCWTLFLLTPITMCDMTMQSTGHRLAATVLSALKSGLYFIPLILILSRVRGLAGIQEAQPIAELLAFLTAIPFIVHYFRKLPQYTPEE